MPFSAGFKEKKIPHGPSTLTMDTPHILLYISIEKGARLFKKASAA